LLPRIHYQDLNQKEQKIEIKGKGRRSGTRGQESSNQIKSKRTSSAAMREGGSEGGGR
jgi:hypothetical protein